MAAYFPNRDSPSNITGALATKLKIKHHIILKIS